MKAFNKLLTAAIVCFAAISCTDPVPDTKPRDPVVFQNASATYYGATENSEAYFVMDLTDGGKKLHLEFYGNPVGDYDAPTLKTGNYSLAAGSATEPGTFIAGSSEGGCVYSEANGANADLYNIIGGVFSISLSGTTYNVSIGLRDQDGNDLQGSYAGPITVADTRERMSDFVSGFTSFYGKNLADDAHLFWVGLDSNGITWDSGVGAYIGDGYFVRLCVMTGTDAFTEIPDGTYNVAESTAPGSIMIDNINTYYGEVVGDVVTAKPLTSGSATFQKTGDLYNVVMDITDADGNNYKKFYQGELEYANYSGGLTDNLDMGAFASGEMSYYGKTDNGDAYNFFVALLGNGVGLDSEGYINGTGYIMLIDMYTEMTSKTDINPATYSVAYSGAPGTVMEGSLFWFWDVGSYIYEVENGSIVNTVYITGGTVTVSGANPSYNFQIAFKESNNFNITGSYSGSLEYFDESSDNIVLPVTGPTNRHQLTSLDVSNWGDYYETGTTTNLDLVFESSEIELYLEILTTDIGDSTMAPAGTYTFADTHLANTFTSNSSIYYQGYEFYVDGGTMTITDAGNERTYTIDLDMGDRGMFYAEYKFTVPGDINVTAFNGGSVMYYGSQFSEGISNCFFTNLYGQGISIVDGYYQGTGCVFRMDLYADLAAITEIPAGVYNVTNSYAPGNILISDDDTRYIEITNGAVTASRPLRSGSATVSKSGNTYTFDMAFVDSNGANITGLFVGELEYSDRSNAPAPAPMNYVELSSAKGPAQKMILSKPDKAKPAAKKEKPANRLSKEAVKKNASEYRKSTGAMRMAQNN